MFRLRIKPQTNDFHEFVLIVLYVVADRSFTADGGLLLPTGGVKTTPQKDLYKEFAYRSEIELMVTATTIELTT